MLNVFVAGVTLLAIFLGVMNLGTPWGFFFSNVAFVGLVVKFYMDRRYRRLHPEPEKPVSFTR